MDSYLKSGKLDIKKQRHTELDIAKALAIVFMISVHVLEEIYVYEINFAYMVIQFLGSQCCAPVLMFIMGATMVYSKKQNPNIIAKRGLKLLFFSYILNFFVFALPTLILNVIENSSFELNIFLGDLLGVDILQFAGIFMMVFALLKILKFNKYKIIILVLIMEIAQTILTIYVPANNIFFQAISGLLWGSSEISYFPFFVWSIFPFAGYLFAEKLITYDKRKIYTRLLLISSGLFVMLIILAALILPNWEKIFEPSGFYHMDLYFAITILTLVLLIISLCYFLSLILPKAITELFSRFSKKITSIYVIHLFLIYYSSIFIFSVNLKVDILGVVIYSFIITVISYLLSTIISNLNKKYRKIKI